MKEKASTSMGRALQSLFIESLECAKPASNQVISGLLKPKISSFDWYRKMGRVSLGRTHILAGPVF